MNKLFIIAICLLIFVSNAFALDGVIKLHKKADGTFYTLKEAAQEIQLLNQYAGSAEFPRPIKCNPDSTNAEGFIGDANTPPDEFGRVNVRILNYEYIDLDNLPAQPTTFNFVIGKPAETGVFL